MVQNENYQKIFPKKTINEIIRVNNDTTWKFENIGRVSCDHAHAKFSTTGLKFNKFKQRT